MFFTAVSAGAPAALAQQLRSQSPSVDEEPPPAAAQPQPSGKTVLQGGVDHADHLSGLDQSLRVGKVFSDELLQSLTSQRAGSDSEWFRIPSWYAGVRHSDDALIVYRYDFQSGRTSTPMQRQLNRQDSRSGYQTDREGHIWDYKKLPQIQHVEADFCDAVLFVKNITPMACDESHFVVKYEEVSISIAKRSRRILQVVQQEQINTVTSPAPGVLRVDVSVKSFDFDGNPQRQEQSVIMAQLVKPYERVDVYQGEDLRPLFRDYLLSHHLENLLPQDKL